MELLRGPGWRLVRKGRNPAACKMSRGLSRRRLLRLGARVCFLVHPKAREFSRSTARSGWPHPQPTGELTQQGTIFLWISDCSRIIFREGKLERRAYFIDGETCRRTQLKEMGSWRDSPGIFQKWLLLVSQAIEYLPLRSNPKIWRWCGPMTW